MNLYIFNETRRGAIFGIGTYIRELVIALKDSDIHISIINLMSDKPQIQMRYQSAKPKDFYPNAPGGTFSLLAIPEAFGNIDPVAAHTCLAYTYLQILSVSSLYHARHALSITENES